LLLAGPPGLRSAESPPREAPTMEWQLPNEKWKQPFEQEVPIHFLSRNQNPDEWDKLPAYWNPTTEKATSPKTAAEVQRKAGRIEGPRGLTLPRPIPAENPLTLDKWKLGKRLYFDGIISADGSVSCATCHNPRKGYTDQSPVSTGIRNLRGGMSAP